LQHLKESEAQLIQSEKMSSLGQMVAGVAHEINTPLAYVKNSLGTVADKLPELRAAIERCDELLKLLHAGGNVDPEELNRQFAAASAQLAQIRQQKVIEELGGLVTDGLYGTGQMAEIVGNLKDFSRLDRSKVTSFNLNDGLNSTLMLAKHLLKPLAVKKQLGGIPSIVCSPSQVNQVFLNLITNATQALEGQPRNADAYADRRAARAAGVAVEFCRQRQRHRSPTCCPGSSIRSSAPKRSARAPVSGCPSPTRSCSSTAAASMFNRRSAQAANSRCGCR
jgi:C4-dicarboxylate-specific signal transduction histidine kinase